jgi:hypothetical protein
MIIISKTMLALSALVSTGLVAALDVPSTATENQAPAIQVSQRFPAANEMFSPVPMSTFAAHKFAAAVADGSKGDRLTAADSCERAGWPYFSQDCLVSADGGPVRKVSRVITIERRIGDNTSELTRMPVADLAQR